MTLSPKIDIHDLKSVRDADVVLGDDFVAPDGAVDKELRVRRERRRVVSINRSPLARKIITFNLMALILLAVGILYMNPSRDNLAFQRATALVDEAFLIADVFEAQIPSGQLLNTDVGNVVNVQQSLDRLQLRNAIDVFVYNPDQTLVASSIGLEREGLDRIEGLSADFQTTFITDFMISAWTSVNDFLSPLLIQQPDLTSEEQARLLLTDAIAGETHVSTGQDRFGLTVFTVVTPIMAGDVVIGAVAVGSATGEIDLLVRAEREQVVQIFFLAVIVSIGLSLVLASTIANPLADLAAAAELGRDKNARKMSPGRIRIPDLTARPDEIGRLSGALHGMVGALYDRIEANEQFAADVAHEIKNPLASLRSAVGTMRVAKRDDQRERLLEVIEHDVRRLDRLVSDISNASRLDSELVKEDEETFDLLNLLTRLAEHLQRDADEKGIEFITDFPAKPIRVQGLEERLAQVFVNLITNAISFCGKDDAIRIWARKRENRVLIVVEDTGPGIPEQALSKIFKRFYSERPEGQFGNNSGLGLAISKQIVEAHGGVIWAENIRPSEGDANSPPLGARFVVGLPV
ncbi:sensor histidine kinase [Pseudaestuariivita rosea]|uniref:sensor histidine kinase n=1 Tax=Pseudaestuariivita rosea TaxID=2763263 RepID=UPI001ABAC625|nr:sensor histidine kinase [Pseudaestuariivita rosea]